MATDVIMPALGVAQQTGKLLKWFKAEGQVVSKGEPLMEVETDKATVEIEAPASGVLAQVIANAGDEVPVGNCIAAILAPGETAGAPAKQNPHPRPLPREEGIGSRSAARAQEAVARPPLPGEGRAMSSTPVRAAIAGRILASPAARRIAREKGIDLGAFEGSGPEGSILARDVLRAAHDQASPADSTHQIVPLSAMRRIIGERMAQSKRNAPHFYLNVDIDMSRVAKLRSEAKQRGRANTPSINDLILRACAQGLKQFPSLNASFTEAGIRLHQDINIGMAVALEEGLVVPVIRQADRLDLAQLAARTRELAEKAQNKKLLPLDYEGGTFTVSNLGMLGVDSFVAIINPPQCAILAVGRIAPRVVADEDMFAIRTLMTATLSADHRVVDGAIGARFLQAVKVCLESPEV